LREPVEADLVAVERHQVDGICAKICFKDKVEMMKTFVIYTNLPQGPLWTTCLNR